MLYPLTFHPIFKERVWGGRKLEQLYRKPLPAGVPIGESWEISDRPGDASVIANGPLAGKDIRWLMENHPGDLLGNAPSQNGKFPLLVKILDAQEKLSLQVHPPAAKARELGGEPKTEMWYLADAVPGAELFAGLRRGVSRAQFIERLEAGLVEECFHRIPVHRGDALFLPSGRVHALGAGVVIFEIQQNSDTTYRVFDWNRLGLDGRPRALHIPESLASIDFNDFEPALISAERVPADTRGAAEAIAVQRQSLVRDPLFRVEVVTSNGRSSMALSGAGLKIIGVVRGCVSIGKESNAVELKAGQFCVLPASCEKPVLQLGPDSVFLLVEPGN